MKLALLLAACLVGAVAPTWRSDVTAREADPPLLRDPVRQLNSSPPSQVEADVPIFELSFNASAQVSYFVEVRNVFAPGSPWRTLTNFAAGANRTLSVAVPAAGTAEFFRVNAGETNALPPQLVSARSWGTPETKVLVIPKGASETFGNWRGGLFGTAVDYQSYYNPLNFQPLLHDRITIREIGFRVDENYSKIDVLVAKVEIYMSTFPKPPSELSFIPGENQGLNRILVFSGGDVHFQGSRNINNPGEFQIRLPLTQEFNYEPAVGGLLVEFHTEEPITGTTGFADGVEVNDDSVISVTASLVGPVMSHIGNVLQLTTVSRVRTN